MDFALLNAVRNLPDATYPLQEVYADYISDAVLAEELGFTHSWYGEHHFRPCQWTGSPMMVAAAVAARTSRIRVGSAVTLLPFHDPRWLAEDAAIADILSGGRFDLGVGPGSQYEEFVTFGIEPKEMIGRSWESIDWIQRALREPGEFSHHGRFYDIPDMTFTTKPVQDPLPVWWGGMGPRNLARAAERGFDLIGPFNAGYEHALAAGHDPADHQMAVMVPVCVADTADKAWEIAGRGIEYFVNFYQMRKNLEGVLPGEEARVTIDMLRSGNAGFWFAAVGTPDDVIAQLTPVVAGQRLGHCSQLALQMRQTGMRTEDTHRSMRLFAAEVMPALLAT